MNGNNLQPLEEESKDDDDSLSKTELVKTQSSQRTSINESQQQFQKIHVNRYSNDASIRFSPSY